MMFLKLISVRGWLAIGAVVAVLAFISMGSALAKANGKIGDLRSARDESNRKVAALTAQIKDQAKQEGQRYAEEEARWRAQCGAAYDAGARRLRDDAAVTAGRYMPRGGSGSAGR